MESVTPEKPNLPDKLFDAAYQPGITTSKQKSVGSGRVGEKPIGKGR